MAILYGVLLVFALALALTFVWPPTGHDAPGQSASTNSIRLYDFTPPAHLRSERWDAK